MIKPFRFWCQTALPLVYDDSLSYYELLCKVVTYLNKVIEDVNQTSVEHDKLWDAIQKLEFYVRNYLGKDVVTEEVNKRLDELVSSGELAEILDNIVTNKVEFDFLANHVARNGEEVLNDGTGDCCLITFKGKHYLVDCWYRYGMREYAIPYLKQKGIDVLDGVFITHYHGDHFGGLQELMGSNGITVNKVYLPPAPDFTQPFFATADNKDIQFNYNYALGIIAVPYEFVSNREYDLGDGLTVKVMNTDYEPYYAQTLPYPTGENTNYPDKGVYADYNNMSVCYMFKYQGYKALFAGDIGYTAMMHLTKYMEKVDVFSVNHHGHNNYVMPEFYSKINPEVAVIQDTYNEYFGSAYTSNVKNRFAGKYLRGCGVKTYATLGSNVIVTVGNNGVNIVKGDTHYDYSIFKFYGKQYAESVNMFDQFAIAYPEYEGDANECYNGVFRLGVNSKNIPTNDRGYLVIDFSDTGWQEMRTQIAVAHIGGKTPLWFRSWSSDGGLWTEWRTLNAHKYHEMLLNNEVFTARTNSNRVSECGGVVCLHFFCTTNVPIEAKTSVKICDLIPDHIPWGFTAGTVMCSNDDVGYIGEVFVDSSGVVKLWCANALATGTKIEGTFTFIPY